MPLATNPNQTFLVSLSTDIDIPEETRPAFRYRYSSGAHWRRIKEFHAAVMSANVDTDMPFDTIDTLFDHLRDRLVGWENMTDPDNADAQLSFEPGRLNELLTLGEAFELLTLKMSQLPDDKDKKKLESPLPSSSESSAETVPDPENVETNPAPPLL